MEQQLILDRYRPLDELGRGGFAEVTLAWDTRMQRRVAIKRMPLPRDARGAVQHNPPGLAEARTAAMLNHPAIVTVYDFETDFDEAFLIMEHVDGASLEDLLDDVGGALTLDETAAVFDAVASALTFAHENGVLHLDIKPANVLVARDGRVKVSDFGMAQLSRLSGFGASWGGTLGYMPLEQLEGGPVFAGTDEWALAVLTFECLTGDDPFAADDPHEAIRLLRSRDLPNVGRYENGVPAAVDDILFAATGPSPDDRYPSVAEFADALEPYLGDPLAGRDSLRELVGAYAEDESPAPAPGWERVGAWDRTRERLGALVLRAIAGGEAAWLAWAGLAPTRLPPLASAGGAALAALAGVLAPPLGVALGLAAFAVGLFALKLWAIAAVFVVLAASWWWFAARRHPDAAVVPLATPALGAARLGMVSPLLAGFILPPLPAAAAGLAGGVLQVLASAASSQAPPYLAVDPRLLADPLSATLTASHLRSAFANPAALVAILGWPVAAFFMSLACSRAKRSWALLGAVLGGATLAGGNVLARQTAAWLHQPAAVVNTWSGGAFAVSLAGSLILIVLVIALGAPVRAEEEDLVHVARGADEE